MYVVILGVITMIIIQSYITYTEKYHKKVGYIPKKKFQYPQEGKKTTTTTEK